MRQFLGNHPRNGKDFSDFAFPETTVCFFPFFRYNENN